MKKKTQKYVLHQSKGGKSDRWIIFDTEEKRDIRGKLQQFQAIKMLKELRKNDAPK